jgi:diacylglycerol kinase (ATP)
LVSSDSPEALLILHPRAHRHPWCEALLFHLAQGYKLTIEKSRFPGQTRQHVRRHLTGFKGIVFTAGGDGTLHEAINGWADLGFPEGVRFVPLPLGTGNDFLYSINTAFKEPDAFFRFPLLREEMADLGRVSFQTSRGEDSRYFCVGATAGFSAVVTERRARLADKIPGTLSYLFALGLSLVFWRNRRLRLESEETPLESDVFFNFNAANVKHYGGGMVSAPEGDPFRRCLHAVCMNLTLPQVFRALPENFRGRFERVQNVHQLELRKPFRVDCYPECPVQADGEPLGRTPMGIACLPGKLPILLPQVD